METRLHGRIPSVGGELIYKNTKCFETEGKWDDLPDKGCQRAELFFNDGLDAPQTAIHVWKSLGKIGKVQTKDAEILWLEYSPFHWIWSCLDRK